MDAKAANVEMSTVPEANKHQANLSYLLINLGTIDSPS